MVPTISLFTSRETTWNAFPEKAQMAPDKHQQKRERILPFGLGLNPEREHGRSLPTHSLLNLK